MAQPGTDLFVRDDDFTDPWQPSDAVILIHGFARNGGMWRGWVPHLGRRHRVLRPDLRGCGDSPDPGPEFAFTLDGFLSDVKAILDARGIERAHIVGEGIGGVIGASMAADDPDRVLSLTMMTMPMKVDESIQRNHALGYPSWQEAIEDLGTRGWWLKARQAGGDLTGDEAIDAYFADQVAKTPAHVAVALSRWATTWDFAEILPRVKVPALLIWAEGASFVSQQQRDEITRLLGDGRQAIIEGVATQMLGYIHPDRVAPVAVDFIDGND